MARGAQLLVFTGPRVPDGLRHVPLAPGERLRRHRERHAVQHQPDVFLPPRKDLLHTALDPCLSLLQLGGIESTDLRQSFPEIPVPVEHVRHRPLRHSQLPRRTNVVASAEALCRHFFTKSTIACSCATDNLRFRPQLPYLAWGISVPRAACTAWTAFHTALYDGVSPAMFTTSPQMSLKPMPSSVWRCHARAASSGCNPRGWTFTCTVGMTTNSRRSDTN